MHPPFWGELWAWNVEWQEDPPPCESCLVNWGNGGGGGNLGGVGGGGSEIEPCKDQSLGYSYYVIVKYQLISPPTSPNHTKQLTFGIGGFQPNSSKSIRLPVPQTGKYKISILVTSEECEDCCTPPSTEDKEAHVQYSLSFDRDLSRSSNGTASLPIDIEKERVSPACIRTDECK